jgi:HlyD family type I secretion membrane fusion protein
MGESTMNGSDKNSDFKSAPLITEPDIPLKTNTKPIIIIALLGLILSFGVFMVWAFFAPLGEAVVAHGEVTVVSNKKTVQHQYGGTIREILVRDGDKVIKGQVLLRLNDSQPKATLSTLRSEYYLILAMEARLLAERNRAGAIDFPKEIKSLRHLPEIAGIITTQQEFFNARRGAHANEINILKGNIAATEEYIKRLEELQSSYQKQMELLTHEMKALRELADQGYYPRTKIVEMERMWAELSGKSSESLGNIVRSRSSVSEYKLSIVRSEQEFLKDVEAQLSEVQKKSSALKDQYAAALDVLEKTEIRATEEGFVVGMMAHTIGGVITPGQGIMNIVPLNVELIVEAKVMPQDRDRVRENLNVSLMFTAFDTKRTPVIEGKVILISADRLMDEASRTPYYLCKVRLTEKGIRQLGDHHLQPGMPVQVTIRGDHNRTLMDYLIKPLFDRISITFKER